MTKTDNFGISKEAKGQFLHQKKVLNYLFIQFFGGKTRNTIVSEITLLKKCNYASIGFYLIPGAGASSMIF